jgi:D-3-phosphoglycerate dehydrogenase / 2-oxoglutarate reductase
VIAQFSNLISGAGINVVEMINDCRGEYAYTIMELETPELPALVADQIAAMPELIKMRDLGTSA